MDEVTGIGSEHEKEIEKRKHTKNELAKCLTALCRNELGVVSSEVAMKRRKINLPSEDIVKFYHHVPRG